MIFMNTQITIPTRNSSGQMQDLKIKFDFDQLNTALVQITVDNRSYIVSTKELNLVVRTLNACS